MVALVDELGLALVLARDACALGAVVSVCLHLKLGKRGSSQTKSQVKTLVTPKLTVWQPNQPHDMHAHQPGCRCVCTDCTMAVGSKLHPHWRSPVLERRGSLSHCSATSTRCVTCGFTQDPCPSHVWTTHAHTRPSFQLRYNMPATRLAAQLLLSSMPVWAMLLFMAMCKTSSCCSVVASWPSMPLLGGQQPSLLRQQTQQRVKQQQAKQQRQSHKRILWPWRWQVGVCCSSLAHSCTTTLSNMVL